MWAAAALVGPLATKALLAQTPVPVLVTQLAGANVYVGLLTAQTLRAGDTVSVLRTGSQRPLGAMIVVASSASRCVLVFAGVPFPLTRGDTLQLAGLAGALPVAVSPRRETALPDAPGGPVVDGTMAFEFSGMRSTTTGLGADPEKVTRTYALPSIYLQAQASRLPGGGRLSLHSRIDYRTGGNTGFDPATSVHFYGVRLDQPLATRAVQLTVGRFVNIYDPLSGYWDGGQLFIGKDRRLGIGVAAGFEPTLANEGVTTALPKYGVFGTAGTANRHIAAYSNLSAVLVTPHDDRADQLVSSWSSRLSTPTFRFSHDLLAERDQATGDWRVGRFHALGALTTRGHLELSAGYAYDAPEILAAGVTVIPFRRQRWTVGGAWWGESAIVTADLALSRRAEGTRAGAGVGLRVSGSYWTDATDHGFLIAPTLDRSLGTVHGRIGYQFYRTEADRYTVTLHRGDAQADIRVGPALFAIVRASAQYGPTLTSFGVVMSLVWRFGS